MICRPSDRTVGRPRAEIRTGGVHDTAKIDFAVSMTPQSDTAEFFAHTNIFANLRPYAKYLSLWIKGPDGLESGEKGAKISWHCLYKKTEPLTVFRQMHRLMSAWFLWHINLNKNHTYTVLYCSIHYTLQPWEARFLCRDTDYFGTMQGSNLR